MTLVRTINKILDRAMSTTGNKTVFSQARGNVWASLARYDDDFVENLESWERHTRNVEGDFGRRRDGSEHLGDEGISEIFENGKWDEGKMVRSFAKLGRTEKKIVVEDERQVSLVSSCFKYIINTDFLS
jgi:phosphatidylinositol-3,4,5-trisphosphate 3-phosphatase/dual-specificity protein phosphatase PTEN